MTDQDKADDATALSPAIQDHIGASLRAMYNEVVSAPVPDRFFALLEALDRGAAKGANDAPPDEANTTPGAVAQMGGRS